MTQSRMQIKKQLRVMKGRHPAEAVGQAFTSANELLKAKGRSDE